MLQWNQNLWVSFILWLGRSTFSYPAYGPTGGTDIIRLVPVVFLSIAYLFDGILGFFVQKNKD